MPYVDQTQRIKFIEASEDNYDILEEVGELCENAGDLNYAITVMLKTYMEKKGECYAVHDEIIGMLECCKLEWYRTRTAPYEDLKRKENGDV